MGYRAVKHYLSEEPFFIRRGAFPCANISHWRIGRAYRFRLVGTSYFLLLFSNAIFAKIGASQFQ